MTQSLLIIYSTKHQQSYKVANYINQQLVGDYLVQLMDIKQVGISQLQQCDVVIIGAPIRMGHFPKLVLQFINQYSHLLNTKPSAFFGLNLVARKANKNTVATNSYMQKFLAKISWQPDLVEVFAGAVQYTKYNWWEKAIIKFIMLLTGGHTDTTVDIEYTQWDKVQSFANQIQQQLLTRID